MPPFRRAAAGFRLTRAVFPVIIWGVDKTTEKALFERLDRMIFLMEEAAKQPTVFVKILNLAAMIAGILGAITIIDVLRSWIWRLIYGFSTHFGGRLDYLQRASVLRGEKAQKIAHVRPTCCSS